jgi:outer membrane immunogenic protein
VRRKLLSLLVVSFAIFGARAASAADLALKAPVLPTAAPAYNWGGWYVGGNIGYGWGASSDPNVSFVDPGGAIGLASYFPAGGNVTPDLNPNGVIGGGQIGFNWVLNPTWVAGLVADFQGSGIKASATNSVAPGIFTPSNQSNSEQIDWFGTVRGKLGYAQNNWLLYATGGLAYGRVATSGNFNFPSIPGANFPGSSDATNVGWTLGAGLNYALTANWIVGFEYLYVDLGRVSYTESNPNSLAPTSSITINNRVAAQIARATLDYKF